MQSKKTNLNMVVIGHIGSGKSTTAGHLIYKLGGIEERTLNQFEVESAEIGKSSFKYAWVMDKLRAERERGLTIDISFWNIETNKFQYTIIDTPGHRDFIKNMIDGINLADVALVIVASPLGELEAGASMRQIRENYLLAYIFGIRQVICCINKMDDIHVNYSQARYEEIVTELKTKFKEIEFSPQNVPFIPISGWTGENLIEPSSNMSWYRGDTLAQALDKVSPPNRQVGKPLRLSIQDVYKIPGIGPVLLGRVESGILKPEMTVQFAPTQFVSLVKTIEINHKTLQEGRPGDIVGFHCPDILAQDVKKGFVASDYRNDPARECISFTAQIIILSHPGQIKQGYTPVVDCHAAHIPCKFTEIFHTVQKKTGKVLEDRPKFLKSGDTASVKLTPIKPMCVEKFIDYPPLGRFVVRDSKNIVAVGIIMDVEKVTKDKKLSVKIVNK